MLVMADDGTVIPADIDEVMPARFPRLPDDMKCESEGEDPSSSSGEPVSWSSFSRSSSVAGSCD